MHHITQKRDGNWPPVVRTIFLDLLVSVEVKHGETNSIWGGKTDPFDAIPEKRRWGRSSEKCSIFELTLNYNLQFGLSSTSNFTFMFYWPFLVILTEKHVQCSRVECVDLNDFESAAASAAESPSPRLGGATTAKNKDAPTFQSSERSAVPGLTAPPSEQLDRGLEASESAP